MSDRLQLGLARIERETVQERVYGVLRDRLMRGGFEPGQKLKIAELASALGTSAMPVREALNRLAAERAIESLPNRSVRVPALSRDALQDLMETRFAVEGLAVARAAANMTAETLAQLRNSSPRRAKPTPSTSPKTARVRTAPSTSRSTGSQGRPSCFQSSRASGCSSAPTSGSLPSASTVAKVAAPTSTSRSSTRSPAATAKPRAPPSNPTSAAPSSW
jgi:hypothetical protein